MPDLVIQVDEAKLAEVQALLAHIKNGLPRVLTRAINKVGGKAHAQTVRELAAATKLKQKEVRRHMRLRRATWKRLLCEIWSYGRDVRLIAFGARQTTRGVTAKLPPGLEVRVGPKGLASLAGTESRGGRPLFAHAFIAEMPSGHKGVFVRYGEPRIMKRGRYAGKRRQPIEELFVPELRLFFCESGLRARVVADADAMLPREIDMQVRVLLDQQSSGVLAKIDAALERKDVA